jgi:hypothetical protein
MTRKTRTLFAILFGVPLLLVLPLAFLGASILVAGDVEVHVAEKGECAETVDIRVPAALLPALVRLTPVGAVAKCHMEPEARRACRLATALLRALEDAPDGVYVDVRTRDEIVLVEKKDGALRVDVDTPEEVVHAAAPLRAVRSVLGAI